MPIECKIPLYLRGIFVTSISFSHFDEQNYSATLSPFTGSRKRAEVAR